MAKRKFNKKVSLHKTPAGVVEVKRKWAPDHIAAKYHEKEWGEPSTRGHKLHGVHKTPLQGKILVDHAEGPPKYELGEGGGKILVSGSSTSAPEFKLTFEDGSSIHVLCADTVKEYLRMAGKKVR